MRKKIYNTLNNKERNGFLFVDLIVSLFICFLLYLLLKTSIDHYIYKEILNAQYDLSQSGIPSEDIDTDSLNGFLYTFCHIISFFIIWVFYISISSFFIGFTLGSHLFNIKLIDIKSYSDATIIQRIIRGAVTVIDCLFLLGLGSIYSFFNEERLTLADKIAKTKVASVSYVKVKKVPR